jgi:hypothetical protein
MTDEPLHIKLELREENEDGSATYTFICDDSTAEKLRGLAMEFILHCAAVNMDTQDALQMILKHGVKDYG